MLAPLNRIIVFVADVQKCAAFYREAFELEAIASDDPEGWQELDAGGCRLAFHKARGAKGPTGSAQNPHKIVFHSDDVPGTREQLIQRGVDMGKVMTYEDLVFCDGRDTEGHRFQISNRA